MSKINYKQAREMLSQACEHYIGNDMRQYSAYGAIEYKNMQQYVFWFDNTGHMESYHVQYTNEDDYFEEFKFGQIRGAQFDAPLFNPCVVLHNLTALTRLWHHIMTNLNDVPNFGYRICWKLDDSVIEKNKV